MVPYARAKSEHIVKMEKDMLFCDVVFLFQSYPNRAWFADCGNGKRYPEHTEHRACRGDDTRPFP